MINNDEEAMMAKPTIAPTEAEAQAAYRAAWLSWCCSGSQTRGAMEYVMDSMQPHIAKNPKDPRWAAFIATLPGYTEAWSEMAKAAMRP